MSAVHFTANNTFCVLDGHPSLSLIDLDNHKDHAKGNDNKEKKLERTDRPNLQVFNDCGNGFRKTRHNTTEDNKRNTITDAVFGDLLADPHQKACACCQNYDNESEIKPAVIHQCMIDTQCVSHAESLHDSKENREVSCDFLDLLIPFLPVFPPFFQCGNNGSQKLHNNGRIDVRGNTHGKK